jgi:hypothetical protein
MRPLLGSASIFALVLLAACPSDGGGASPTTSSSTGEADSSTAATIDPTPATLDGSVSDTATTTEGTTADPSDTVTSGTETTTNDPDGTGTTSTETTGSPDDSTSTTETTNDASSTTSDEALCGDGVAEGAELCDGDDLGGVSCIDLGFEAGSLACDAACAYDTRECSDEDPGVYEIGFCRLQFPTAIETIPGAQIDVFGRVYIAGLTDLSDTNDVAASVGGWVGIGPDGSDPEVDAGWIWTAGAPNPGYGPASPGAEANNDEYQALLTAPDAGSYDFAFRFSGDGGVTFTYCDGQPAGNSDGYQPANAGQLVSEA